MLSGAISSGILGIEAKIVEIEVDIVRGLPGFTIVGLPDSTIRESRERIRSAIENSGYEFPPRNFVVNLAPADFKKQGATYDLPIAMAILKATGQVFCETSNIPMAGELSLDGSVKPVKGVISMVLAFMKDGYKSLIVPGENRDEAAAISGMDVYPVKSISEAVTVLNGEGKPYRNCPIRCPSNHLSDFRDVRGQETAKRALEIAAAGMHNIILYGAPGSGKTMLARRLPSIMPHLDLERSIETTMIHSVGGKLAAGSGLVTIPPFRAPHHTASDAALAGGGRFPSVGEVSLAHNGILFLDELVHFRSNTIQALRQPLEDHEITISRSSGTHTFPSDFMLIGASNPCDCGFLFDNEIQCRCPPHRVSGFFRKIAGPILDRIDMEVLVKRVSHEMLTGNKKVESSADIKKRVTGARAIQKERFRNSPTEYNSRMTSAEIQLWCGLNTGLMRYLEIAISKMTLTARSYFKVLKISRTIADLEGTDEIKKEHILEALSYKNLQRNYEILPL